MKEIEKPPFVTTFESLLLPIKLFFNLEVPFIAKLIPTTLFIIYLVLPFDLIADFIPIAGTIDDLAVLTACAYLLVKLTPKEIVDKYLEHPLSPKIIDIKSKSKK